MSSYSDYTQILKQKTSNWTRYKGTIDIIDETTIQWNIQINQT